MDLRPGKTAILETTGVPMNRVDLSSTNFDQLKVLRPAVFRIYIALIF